MIIWIIPLVWMLSLSLSDNDALQRDTTSLLPVEPTLDNFTTLFDSGRTPTMALEQRRRDRRHDRADADPVVDGRLRVRSDPVPRQAISRSRSSWPG